MLGGNPIKEASFSDELVVVAFRYSPIIEVTRELAIFSRANLGTPLYRISNSMSNGTPVNERKSSKSAMQRLHCLSMSV